MLDRTEARPGEVIFVTVYWSGFPDEYGDCKGAAAQLFLSEDAQVPLCGQMRPMVGSGDCNSSITTLPLLIPYEIDPQEHPFLSVRAGLAYPEPWRWYCMDDVAIRLLPAGPPPTNPDLCCDDCNQEGTPDWQEICNDPTVDENRDGILDECQLTPDPPQCCVRPPHGTTFVPDRTRARPGEEIQVKVYWQGNFDGCGGCSGVAARLTTDPEGGETICRRIRPNVGTATCEDLITTLLLQIPRDLDPQTNPSVWLEAGLAFAEPFRWYSRCEETGPIEIQIIDDDPLPGEDDLCSDDCNSNGVRDWEEICGNSSLDCDFNGVLDECEDYEPVAHLFVDASAVGRNNGTSWEHAYTDLRSALADSEERECGISLWIARGVYRPGPPGSHRSATFGIRRDTVLYGGFLGDEELLEERNPDPETNGTVLCGDLSDNDAPGRNREDNAYHVVSVLDAGLTPILDGFTIRGGNATDLFGAGMRIDGAAPLVRNCVFEDNWGFHGAAMSVVGEGSPEVINCVFRENQADLLGGAISLHSSGAEIVDCVFTENRVTQALGHGGAIYNFESSPVIRGCRFVANGPSDAGGAICNWQRSSPIIADCRFEGNFSILGGGIMNVNESSPTITNCIFRGNTTLEPARKGGGIYSGQLSEPTVSGCTFQANSANLGGAMYNRGGSNSTIVNCAFVANQAVGTRGQGGGVYNLSASPSLLQCTFTANSAMVGASVYNSAESFPMLANSILFSGGPAEIQDVFGSDTTVTFSTIRGGYAGEGNIDASPLLLRDPDPGDDGVWGTEDDDYGDLQLSPGSPCIDAANNEVVPEGIEVDLANRPRFVDDPATEDSGRCGDPCTRAVVDMGAHEFQVGGCTRDPQWVCDGDVDGDGQVNPVDSGLVQAVFGSTDEQDLCNYDVDCDGQINPVDSGIVQSLFGTCEAPRDACP